VRAVVQRVSSARVEVEGVVTGEIGPGLLILLGVSPTDGEAQAQYLARKIAELRIFEDANQKMNLSLLETRGSALVVSQFTLYGDCRKGRRPNFSQAAPGPQAEALYLYFIERLKALGLPTAQGRFGAMMEVSLVNQGPVTLIVESREENS